MYFSLTLTEGKTKDEQAQTIDSSMTTKCRIVSGRKEESEGKNINNKNGRGEKAAGKCHGEIGVM